MTFNLQPTECKRCKVLVDPSFSHCPVCGSFLKKVKDSEVEKVYPTPQYKKIAKAQNRSALIIFLSLSIMVVLLTLLLDLALNFNRLQYTFYVAVSVVYIWILVTNTILSRVTLGTKLFWQGFGLSLVVTTFDVSFNTALTWSLTWVIPLMLVFNSVFLMAFLFFAEKIPQDDYIYLMLFTALNLIHFGIVLFNPTYFIPILGYISGAVGLLAILGTVTIAQKRFSTFLKSWFHF